ncbi:MAG: UbiX family flavin prenyltransferase [Thermoplasmata archaeon]|nr:UbiX family flavin prenyltransferase [Thermoplasmata archaeon]
MEIIVAITGASGAIYGLRLIEKLKNENVYLILSNEAKKIIGYETSYDIEKIKGMVKEYYEEEQMESKLASGSFNCDAMVIAPCSLKTMSAVANGFTFNLIVRAAICCLKENKKLIIVPRETPLDEISIENMLKLKKAGVIILPAMPAFYYRPRSIDDLVNYIVGKIMSQLGLKHNLYRKWK